MSEQQLWHWQGDTLLATYAVSTSLAPPSCIENSLGTPDGLFSITERIGEDAPLGMVFKGRVPLGYPWWEASSEEQAKALITSRILRLTGLEKGHNQGGDRDTWNRYIYLHGTNRPARIGTPQSAGCILLEDRNMIHLFNQTPIPTHLYIDPLDET